MKGKTLSTYAAALIITVFGSIATLLIVDAGTTLPPEDEYASLDPFDLNTDSVIKKNAQSDD